MLLIQRPRQILRSKTFTYHFTIEPRKQGDVRCEDDIVRVYLDRKHLSECEWQLCETLFNSRAPWVAKCPTMTRWCQEIRKVHGKLSELVVEMDELIDGDTQLGAS